MILLVKWKVLPLNGLKDLPLNEPEAFRLTADYIQ
jgi:hypothetical protein